MKKLYVAEHRVFAGITAVILLLSSVLLYFSEDDEKNIDDIIAVSYTHLRAHET